MNGKDLLIGLGNISTKYFDEAENDSLIHRKPLRRPMLIAAILALALLLVGCTFAFVWKQLVNVPLKETNVTSSQGFQGTPNYEAFKEWQEFLDTYDPDHALLAENDDFQSPEAYASYGCYTQEMVDKAAEICEKYGLDPLGRPWSFNDSQDIFDSVGIESVFAKDAKMEPIRFSGYCYPDGTFHLEGFFRMTGEWEERVSFGMSSVMKTSFDGVPRGAGADSASADQWRYTRKDGTQVLMALDANSGFLAVDREDCFITVDISDTFANGGYSGDIPTDRAFLEAFCECFDFTYIPHPVDPEAAQARFENQTEPTVHDIPDPTKLSSYREYLEYMVQVEQWEDLRFALIDTNNDGVEELLVQSPNFQEYNCDENSFFQLLTMRDGKIAPMVCGTLLYLCEGNVLEEEFVFEGWEHSHGYYQINEYTDWIVVITHYEQEDQWRRWDLEFSTAKVDITEEEAQAIIAKYPRMDIEFKPISEFPSS